MSVSFYCMFIFSLLIFRYFALASSDACKTFGIGTAARKSIGLRYPSNLLPEYSASSSASSRVLVYNFETVTDK